MDTSTATTGQETVESTEQKSTESSGQGQVETQGSQGQQDNAGEERSSSEGGKGEGTDTRQGNRQFRSKNQTIYELRQGLRERDRQIQELNERFSQFEQQAKRGQNQKTSRTFWEAPEEVLDERITGHLSEMEKRILERMEQRDVQNQQSSEWKQETSEAAKFIQSQRNMTEEDHEEIAELIRSTPEMRNLSPMQRARYGLYLWQQEHGITDKTDLKNKTATIRSGGNVQSGPKVWTRAEVDAKMDSEFGGNVSTWSKEKQAAFDAFEREIQLAAREGRLK